MLSAHKAKTGYGLRHPRFAFQVGKSRQIVENPGEFADTTESTNSERVSTTESTGASGDSNAAELTTLLCGENQRERLNC